MYCNTNEREKWVVAIHACMCCNRRVLHEFIATVLGWLRLVGSLKLWVSSAEHSLFYRALLQKRPITLMSQLTVAIPYSFLSLALSLCTRVCSLSPCLSLPLSPACSLPRVHALPLAVLAMSASISLDRTRACALLFPSISHSHNLPVAYPPLPFSPPRAGTWQAVKELVLISHSHNLSSLLHPLALTHDRR